MWTLGGRVLLEFPPVMAEGKLFLLKNNGAVYAIDKRTGKPVWKRKVGNLAAASPAYGNGRIFVPLLERGKNLPGALYALDAKTGKVLWRRLLPSRTESSPIFDNDRVYFGSESGTRVRAARRRRRASAGPTTPRAPSRARSRWPTASSTSATTRGHVYALRQADGSVAWNIGANSGAFGFRSGQFYSTPAVAYGRVYIGNTDGRMYSFSSVNGKLAWAKADRRLRLLLAGRRAGPGRAADASTSAPTTASSTRSTRATAASAGPTTTAAKISGGSTVVGDIVYFSNIGHEGHDRPRRPHGPQGLPHGPRLVQPRHLRRAHDLPDRLQLALRAQAREIGRVAMPAAASSALTAGIVYWP